MCKERRRERETNLFIGNTGEPGFVYTNKNASGNLTVRGWTGHHGEGIKESGGKRKRTLSCACVRQINLARGQRQTGQAMASWGLCEHRVPLGHGFITRISKCVQVYLLQVTLDQRSQNTIHTIDYK